MYRFILNTALPALAIGLATAPASAAEPAPALDDSAGDPIIVTAQRRAQSARDVGIALSVIGAEEIKARGITNVNQLQDATPSFEVEPAFGGGAPQFRLRGVGFQDYASNNAPTVGIYVNEVAYPVPVMTQGLIFDMQRVEVLRGPQGTLYGRNTTGGAVNFITNRPTKQFSAGGTVEFGSLAAFTGEAYVSGPISDSVSVRVAGATQQGGGYQHNRATGEDLGDANRWGGRGMIEFAPAGSGFDALLDVHYGRDTSEATGLYLLTPLRTQGGAGITIPADVDRFATGWGHSATLIRDTGLTATSKPGVNNKTWGTSLNASYEFGGVRLTSITAYDWLDRKQFGDWDASPSIEADTYFGSKVDVFSQEVRLANASPSAFTWVAGVYYSKQKLKEQYFSDFNNLFGTYGRVNFAQSVESISGFGQAEYAVTSRIKLTTGLRYEYEKRELQGFGSAFGGATALPPTSVSTSMKPLTGKAELQYQFSSKLMAYASASKGTKSGGFTTYNTGSSTGIQPFKPENLYAYEFGFKANPSRAVQINGAFFYYDYRDQQVLSAVYTPGRGAVGRFVNVPKGRVLGVDADVLLRPVPDLTITGYFGYKEGKYLDFQDLDLAASRAADTSVYVDKSGRSIPFSKYSAGGSLAYEVHVGRQVLTPSMTWNWRSRQYSWLGTLYEIPPYAVVNAQLDLASTDGRWNVAVWGRNLLDKKYDLTRNFFTNANIAQPARPLSFGVRLGFHY